MYMVCNDLMRTWPDRLLNILLPHRCQQCGVIVESAHGLCPTCWSGVHFIVPPYCKTCGLPFPHDYGGGEAECARCLAEPPPYETARAAIAYDDTSKSMVLKFKHADQLYLAPTFAFWMKRAAPEWLSDENAILVPVPLHRHRLFMRRYNQSALLAQALGRQNGTAVLLDGLRRHRATQPQGAMTREQRFRNVSGAFRVPQKAKEKINGKTVILVDDVQTTGATLSACAKVLQAAGAGKVRVLTLMRVV